VNLLAVFVGGLAGTGLRLAIDALLPHGPSDFPVSTFVINVAGSFVLAVLVARVWPAAPVWLRLGLGTGMLGSFTTFSAVMVSLLTLATTAPLTGVLYLATSLVAGLGAALAGLKLGGRTPRIQDDE
jgi:CrcB protein